MSSNPHRNRLGSTNLAVVTWLAVCLIAASFFAWRGSSSSSNASYRPTPATVVTKSIEDIRVGERVAYAENPAEPFDGSLGEVVDPATWRVIRLRADKESGGSADVVLLRPEWWINERLDTTAELLTLSVPEVGIDGEADVLSVEPCPEIIPGRGRVVIGTFAHTSPDSIELYVEGLDEPIRCTPDHPTWSHDRQQFIDAQDFNPGELVQGDQDLHRVQRVVPVDETAKVYNLEIHGQHIYQVSELGVLVHNAPTDGNGNYQSKSAQRAAKKKAKEAAAKKAKANKGNKQKGHRTNRRKSNRDRHTAKRAGAKEKGDANRNKKQ